MLYIPCVWNILSDLTSKETFVQPGDLGLTAEFKKQSPAPLGCTEARTGNEMALPGIGWQSKIRCYPGQWMGEQTQDESWSV